MNLTFRFYTYIVFSSYGLILCFLSLLNPIMLLFGIVIIFLSFLLVAEEYVAISIQAIIYEGFFGKK